MQIFLSELLPDPEGRDTEGEFIELVNAGTTNIDLSGWQLDDEDGNTTGPWAIPSGTLLAAGEFRAFYYTQTKVTLNNKDGDAVRLLDPTGRQHDAVRYTESAEGLALARFDGAWEWTNRPTPGAPNVRTTMTMTNDDNNDTTTAAAAPTQQAPAVPASSPATKTSSSSSKQTKTSSEQAPPLPQDATPSLPDEENDVSQLSANISQSGLPSYLPYAGVIVLALLSGAGVVFFRTKQ